MFSQPADGSSSPLIYFSLEAHRRRATPRTACQARTRNSGTRWVSSAVALASYEGSELSAK